MPRGVAEIFLTFARIGVLGFGGVNFWLRRVLVQEKRWVTDQEYVEGLALGQIIPGPNVYNLSVMLGYRFAGWRGTAAAVTGLLGAPMLVILGLALLYQRFSAVDTVQRALGGMTLVAAGLMLANAISLAAALPRALKPWLFLAAAFAGVGLARWPLVYVMGALAPAAIALAWRE